MRLKVRRRADLHAIQVNPAGVDALVRRTVLNPQSERAGKVVRHRDCVGGTGGPGDRMVVLLVGLVDTSEHPVGFRTIRRQFDRHVEALDRPSQ